MNIYKSLNQIIDYIEENLEEEIKYSKLAQMLGVNEYTMQSVFSLLCNISVSEYIRKRRLSNAGADLYASDCNILDIAVKYQYESATSFSRAFEKFHGIKPSQVKKNPSGLKVFTKLYFDESKEITKGNIEYSIVELPELVLYGRPIKTNAEQISEDAPNHFKEMIEKYASKYGYPDYGMTVYEDRFEKTINEYWVLYSKEISEFEKYTIPKSKWLVFHISSYKSEDIQELTHRFYMEFLPSCKYNLKNIPELEYYYDDKTDFMVPIED